MESQFHAQEQQVRREQQLEAVGRLAGGVAHDFSNLLTSLLGHCDLLETDLQGNGADGTHLQEIRAAAERATLLTRQLMAFGRKQVAQPTVLDLNEVIAGIQQLLLLMLNKNVDLDVRLQSSPSLVKADRSELEQVVLNLVLNGRDAMAEGGQLIVQTGAASLSEAQGQQGSAVPAGDYVTLVVKDTGSGMDSEIKAHLFEPFFTTKGKGRGHGAWTGHHLWDCPQVRRFRRRHQHLGRGNYFHCVSAGGHSRRSGKRIAGSSHPGRQRNHPAGGR